MSTNDILYGPLRSDMTDQPDPETATEAIKAAVATMVEKKVTGPDLDHQLRSYMVEYHRDSARIDEAIEMSNAVQKRLNVVRSMSLECAKRRDKLIQAVCEQMSYDSVNYGEGFDPFMEYRYGSHTVVVNSEASGQIHATFMCSVNADTLICDPSLGHDVNLFHEIIRRICAINVVCSGAEREHLERANRFRWANHVAASVAEPNNIRDTNAPLAFL